MPKYNSGHVGRILWGGQIPKITPPGCQDHRLDGHRTQDGEVHFRHNEECFVVPQDWINDPMKDIWAEVLAWIEQQHAEEKADARV